MDNLKQNFQERKKEINNYLDYLKLLDNDSIELKYLEKQQPKYKPVSSEFLTTLIANSFLLLYNIIESTIRNSILSIYDKIDKEVITYDKLSDKLKEYIVKFKIKKLKEDNSQLKEDNSQLKTIQNFVIEFVNSIVSNEKITFDKKWIDFSGNLDAKKIRELANEIGFAESKNGRNLIRIKDKRNRLAHGEHTFYDTGKEFSVKDIIELKDEVFHYLDDVVKNVGDYIDTKSYTK